jgi:ppGpp synthetase/RelA/SpoT-type nucleotidyltranferase
MSARTVVDRLREEYFRLLPHVHRVAGQLEAEINFHVVSIARSLEEHEQLLMVSRVKECESAVESLRKKQEFGAFIEDRPEPYSLTELDDLAGVRVLAFPRGRLKDIDDALRKRFRDWTSNGISELDGGGHSYFGYCQSGDQRQQVRGEYQIVSMLIGRYWDVEHAALYKYRGRARIDEVRESHRQVVQALKEFEATYEKALLRQQSLPDVS